VSTTINCPRCARHDAFRDILARRAAEIGSSATNEQRADAPGANSSTRGDILIQGSAAPDGVAGVIDVTFAAAASPTNQSRMNTIKRQLGEPAVDWTKRQLRYLLAFHEKEKRIKYYNSFRAPFTPMAFSTGGFSSLKSKAWLLRLQAAKQGSESFIFDLSAVIVRARAAALH